MRGEPSITRGIGSDCTSCCWLIPYLKRKNKFHRAPRAVSQSHGGPTPAFRERAPRRHSLARRGSHAGAQEGAAAPDQYTRPPSPPEPQEGRHRGARRHAAERHVAAEQGAAAPTRMAAGSSVSGSSRDPLVLAVALVWFTNLSLSLSPSLSLSGDAAAGGTG
jgi:hypothetical protein